MIAALALIRFAVAVLSYHAQLMDPGAALRVGLAHLGVSAGSYAAFRIALAVLFVLVYYAVAVVIVWRKPKDRMAWFVSLFLVTFGVNASFLLIDLTGANQLRGWLLMAPEYAGWTSLFVFFYLFPDGRFVPRWTGALALIIVAYLAELSSPLEGALRCL